MMATTKDKLIFTHAMARHTSATVRQCEALMRFAHTFKQVTEWAAIEPAKGAAYDRKRLRIANKIGRVCEEITGFTGKSGDTCSCGLPVKAHARANHSPWPIAAMGACVPIFADATVTVRVPGGEGIVVPA